MMTDSGEVLSESNDGGYGQATASYDTSKGNTTKYSTYTETAPDGSYVQTAVGDAENNPVKLTATDENFIGWYYYDANTGEFTKATYTDNENFYPSYSSKDVTFYAMYRASAVYNFKYQGRFGTKNYTIPAADATAEEMTDGGKLELNAARLAEIEAAASDLSNIYVFNKTISFDLTNTSKMDNSVPYQINITGTSTDTPYTLTPYAYNSGGTALEQKTLVSGTWNKACVLPYNYATTKPSEKEDWKFAGWIEKGTGDSYASGNTSTYPQILSTQVNFGYSLAKNMSIEPFFVATDAEVTAVRGTGWQPGIDKNGVTQELTGKDTENATYTGRIYNDTLVNFRSKEDSGTQFTPGSEGTGNCGVVILFQDADSTSENGSAFTGMTDDTAKGYAASMIGQTLGANNTVAAKLNTSYGYGTAYAYRIEAASLSRLNRTDLYMGVDFKKYNGANYKVIAYTKVGSTITYSSVVSGTFTHGQKFPVES